jgi:hypothetical protein
MYEEKAMTNQHGGGSLTGRWSRAGPWGGEVGDEGGLGSHVEILRGDDLR